MDRRIFRAAANAERGAGVVIATHCHRALLLWGRWGGHGGGLQALRTTALHPDFPSSHLKFTVVGTILPRVIAPEVNCNVWPVAMLSYKTEPQAHRMEWFSYRVMFFGVIWYRTAVEDNVTETANVAIISDVNHENYRRESKMCDVTSTATAICWRCTKLHGGTSELGWKRVDGDIIVLKFCTVSAVFD